MENLTHHHNFIARGLGQPGANGEIACGRGSVDRFQRTAAERKVDAHCFIGLRDMGPATRNAPSARSAAWPAAVAADEAAGDQYAPFARRASDGRLYQ